MRQVWRVLEVAFPDDMAKAAEVPFGRPAHAAAHRLRADVVEGNNCALLL